MVTCNKPWLNPPIQSSLSILQIRSETTQSSGLWRQQMLLFLWITSPLCIRVGQRKCADGDGAGGAVLESLGDHARLQCSLRCREYKGEVVWTWEILGWINGGWRGRHPQPDRRAAKDIRIVSSTCVDSERSEAWVPKLEVPMKFSGLEYWHTPLILGPRSQRLAALCEFKARLDYIETSRSARAT